MFCAKEMYVCYKFYGEKFVICNFDSYNFILLLIFVFHNVCLYYSVSILLAKDLICNFLSSAKMAYDMPSYSHNHNLGDDLY